MLASFSRPCLPLVCIPVWCWAFLKANMRIYSWPWRDFWREGWGWRTMSGLIKRITFPSKDPGGWLLPVAMRQASNSLREKTKQMDWVESRELSISFCTDSSPSIKVTSSGFTSLFLHTSLSPFALFHEAHLCSDTTCIQLPLSFPLSPPSYIFFLQSTHLISFELTPSPSPASTCVLLRYSIPSLLWQDAPLHLFALQDKTVVGQRCQISDFEHLENVNAINTFQVDIDNTYLEIRAISSPEPDIRRMNDTCQAFTRIANKKAQHFLSGDDSEDISWPDAKSEFDSTVSSVSSAQTANSRASSKASRHSSILSLKAKQAAAEVVATQEVIKITSPKKSY